MYFWGFTAAFLRGSRLILYALCEACREFDISG